MLQGIVLQHEYVNTHFKANKNLLSDSTIKLNSSAWQSPTKHLLQVKQNNGGLTVQLPISLNQFKNLYFEMDLELLSPDKAHDVKVKPTTQQEINSLINIDAFVHP